jgi:membrane protein
MKKRIKRFMSDIISIIKKPVMSILPGQLAFSFVLTIIPVIAIMGIVGIMLSISINDVAKFIKDTFPHEISTLLLPLINGKGFDFNVFIFLVSAFFLASGGAYSIIVTSDILYDIQGSSALKRRIKSFVITFILITLICFLVIVPGFGEQLIGLINNLDITKSLSRWIDISYDILQYPVSFILVYFNIKLIYTMSPDTRIESKTVTAGALFTSVLWIILTKFYSYYANHFAHYDIFYGSLSNIIMLLLWMYLLSYIFVVGLALNAENQKK